MFCKRLLKKVIFPLHNSKKTYLVLSVIISETGTSFKTSKISANLRLADFARKFSIAFNLAY